MGLVESKEDIERKEQEEKLERIESERIVRERKERERIVIEREWKERIERERIMRERVAIEREKFERERLEREKQMRERMERERIESERRRLILKNLITLLNNERGIRKSQCLICQKRMNSNLLENHLLQFHKDVTCNLHRAFGGFKCKCNNRWKSSWVWCLRLTTEEDECDLGTHIFQQVFAQECRKCETPTFALSIEELTCSNCGAKVSKCLCDRGNRDLTLNMSKPHKTSLCHRCQRLGYPCTGKR
jgi:hypothetical protein